MFSIPPLQPFDLEPWFLVFAPGGILTVIWGLSNDVDVFHVIKSHNIAQAKEHYFISRKAMNPIGIFFVERWQVGI